MLVILIIIKISLHFFEKLFLKINNFGNLLTLLVQRNLPQGDH